MRPLVHLWAVGALLLSVTTADAQSPYSDRPSNVSINIGAYIPSGSTLREEGDFAWKMIGFDYVMAFDELERASNTVGILRANSQKGRFKGELTGLNYTRYWYHNKEERRGPYVGAGVGLHLAKEDVGATFLHPAKSNSGILPGLSLIGGYDLDGNWFAMVRYNMTGQLSSGGNFSGLAISVGAKQLF